MPDPYDPDFVALLLVVNPRLFDAPEILINRLHKLSIPDWINVRRYAERHRVVPLFANRLRDMDWFTGSPMAVDEAQRKGLESDIRTSALAELNSLAEIKRVVSAHEFAKIETTLVKGLVLSKLCFNSLGKRMNRDIDLLIEPANIEGSDSILRSLGYIRIEPVVTMAAHSFREWQTKHKDCVYHHPSKRVILELHHRLFDNELLCFPQMTSNVDLLELFSQIRVNSLRRPELLAYLAMHGAMHGWSRLKWLIDFSILSDQKVNLRADDVDDGGVLSHPVARRSVTTANIMCDRLFGTALRSQSADCFPSDWQTRLLVKVAHKSVVGTGLNELEETRFGTTLKNLSHYLLWQQPRFLAAELKYDLADMSRDAAVDNDRMPKWLRRLTAWLARHF
jgi:Uncharacterised nucleotidyltransferase